MNMEIKWTMLMTSVCWAVTKLTQERQIMYKPKIVARSRYHRCAEKR